MPKFDDDPWSRVSGKSCFGITIISLMAMVLNMVRRKN